MTIPFILDTDTAQDDCVAILLGLLDPIADLRAITIVAGNVGFEQQTENALMTLSVAGALGSSLCGRGWGGMCWVCVCVCVRVCGRVRECVQRGVLAHISVCACVRTP